MIWRLFERHFFRPVLESNTRRPYLRSFRQRIKRAQVRSVDEAVEERVTKQDGSTQSQFGGSHVTAVVVTENGRTVFRIYLPTLSDGVVGYLSEDGLNFVLEGQVPTAACDPKAIVVPDGRIWLVANQFPDAINDVIVHGLQSLPRYIG